jgi:hypothetical protein
LNGCRFFDLPEILLAAHEDGTKTVQPLLTKLNEQFHIHFELKLLHCFSILVIHMPWILRFSVMRIRFNHSTAERMRKKNSGRIWAYEFRDKGYRELGYIAPRGKLNEKGLQKEACQ